MLPTFKNILRFIIYTTKGQNQYWSSFQNTRSRHDLQILWRLPGNQKQKNKKKKQKLHASYLILFFLVVLFWLLLLFRFVGFRFLIRLTGSNILLRFLRLTIIIINAENCESWWYGGRHFCELWIYVLITKTTELPVSLYS